MKILFVGDASNLHNSLAAALRQLGHDVTVVGDGSRWMDTGRDIDLTREPGRMGTLRYVARLLTILPRLAGYDVVHLASPIFLSLRPKRLRHVLDRLRRRNRLVVLSALATDPTYYDACHDGETYRYSDYRLVGDTPTPYVTSSEYIASRQDNWLLPEVREYNNYLLDNVDGVVACLWEYYAAYRRHRPRLPLTYAGIPVDTDAITPLRDLDNTVTPAKVRFFIGIQRDRNVLKGTDLLLAAAKRVVERYPNDCELDVVENLPYAEYVNRMANADVILDQLYSYTPATNALTAMARGLVAVSGAEPEYYSLIGETANHPIVNVSPLVEGDIDRRLTFLVEHKDCLPAMQRASRDFVVKHNDSRLVAVRHLQFWRELGLKDDA